MNIKNLLDTLKKKLYLVILLPILAAAGMGVYSYCFIPNVYTSYVPIYIWQDESGTLVDELNNSNDDYMNSNDYDGMSEKDIRSDVYSNISFNNIIATDIQVYLNSKMIINAVTEELGLESLRGYTVSTDIDPKSPSRVVNISVSGSNPETAADIANCFAKKTQEVTSKFWNVRAINILEEAEPAKSPSGPRRKLYMLISAVLGLCLALLYIAIRCYFDKSIKDKDQIEKLLNIPMLSDIPYVKGMR